LSFKSSEIKCRKRGAIKYPEKKAIFQLNSAVSLDCEIEAKKHPKLQKPTAILNIRKIVCNFVLFFKKRQYAERSRLNTTLRRLVEPKKFKIIDIYSSI
jgi:hypothetical protein